MDWLCVLVHLKENVFLKSNIIIQHYIGNLYEKNNMGLHTNEHEMRYVYVQVDANL